MIPTNELQRQIASSVASVDDEKATALTSAILALPRRAAARRELTLTHPDLLRSAALICDAGTGLSDSPSAMSTTFKKNAP